MENPPEKKDKSVVIVTKLCYDPDYVNPLFVCLAQYMKENEAWATRVKGA